MLRSTRGVTLVELIIAMAIVAILASTVIFGRDQLSARQQFSQGVDQMVEAIANVRNQAASTVGSLDTDPADSPGASCDTGLCFYNYAKSIEFTANSTAMNVSTEIVNKSNVVLTARYNAYIVNTSWGVAPTTTVEMHFAMQSDGSMAAYYSNSAADFPTPALLSGAENGNLKPVATLAGGVVTFMVQDQRGNKANITVDRYGNVSRVFL